MGAVYFIQIGNEGPIKIGFSRNEPAKRISQLQQACPWKLRVLGFVVGSKHHERALHEKLHEHRMEGEWFSSHREVLLLISNVLTSGIGHVKLSELDLAISRAGSASDLERAIGIGSTAISIARRRGMGPKLKARVLQYLDGSAA